MKKISLFIVILALFGACKNSTTSSKDVSAKDQPVIAEQSTKDYESFGEKINTKNVLSSAEMGERFASMQIGDTLEAKFKANVGSVCKKKGCWMRLTLPNDKETLVRFKDYDFFMPKDIKEKEVIVNGKAYLNELSVDDRQHYAKDAGKSEEEIAAITEPKRTMAFMADGVLIKG